MDSMQTIDLILALKELKQNAQKTKQQALEDIAEAEGVLSSVAFMEVEFSQQIEAYHKSRKVNE